MNTIASLIILCTIGVAALVVVSLINRSQTKAKRARQKVKMMKFRVDALEELALILDSTVDTRGIARHIHNEALDLLAVMRKLDPSASYLNATIASAQKTASELADDHGQRQISRLQTSDAQIARTQQALTEAARILRQKHSRGQIADAELDAYLRELSWLHLQVEVISMVGQGMLAMNKQDVMGAFSFYRRAQNCLIQSEQKDPRRQQMIRELNEMLGKKRQHLSLNLMPEASFILQQSSKSNVATPTINIMDTDEPLLGSADIDVDLSSDSQSDNTASL